MIDSVGMIPDETGGAISSTEGFNFQNYQKLMHTKLRSIQGIYINLVDFVNMFSLYILFRKYRIVDSSVNYNVFL